MGFHKRHLDKEAILLNSSDSNLLFRYLTSADAYFCHDNESSKVLELLNEEDMTKERLRIKAIEICSSK